MPLPDGRHLHISWTDMTGHDAPAPMVFTHNHGQPILNNAHTASPGAHSNCSGEVTLSAHSPTSVPAADDGTPLVSSLGLFAPLVTLAWVALWFTTDRLQPGPSPFLRPPRFA